MILICGIAAKVGLPLARLLSAQGVPAKILVGCPMLAARIDSLLQIETVTPHSVLDILAGIDRICMLLPATAQTEAGQVAFITEVANAGVRRVVKLSQNQPGQRAAPADVQADASVERAIADSGMRFTFIRPRPGAGLDDLNIATVLAGALLDAEDDVQPRLAAAAVSVWA